MMSKRMPTAALALLLAPWWFGCKPARLPDERPVTFADQVAPILREHCVTCHHPGGAGPFSLVDYENVRKHGRQIVKVTGRRYMPPWPPERGDIRFDGERGLTAAQIDVFGRWVAGGMLEGNRAALPEPPKFPDGWQLGQPDVVLTMPRAYTLAADGADVFRNFVFSVPPLGPRFVHAIEILAGNKRVVHHANVIVDWSGASRRRDAADAEVGFEGMDVEIASSQFEPDSHFLFWKPGTPPTLEPDDMAWSVDGKTDLVLNMHLRPSGKPETIQPTLGLHFTDRGAVPVPDAAAAGA